MGELGLNAQPPGGYGLDKLVSGELRLYRWGHVGISPPG